MTNGTIVYRTCSGLCYFYAESRRLTVISVKCYGFHVVRLILTRIRSDTCASLVDMLSSIQQREIQGGSNSIGYKNRFHVTDSTLSRLGLEFELKGHTGCVNCIEWNKEGRLLASGSDDHKVILWSPLEHRKLASVTTVHTGNIFSLKFLPYSSDRHIVTGAADCKITIVDIEQERNLSQIVRMDNRVKRIEVNESEPYMIYSASEDGYIMSLDLRAQESFANRNRNFLVDLNELCMKGLEAKCLSVNKLRPELIAVGCSDPYARVYDRRMIRLAGNGSASPSSSLCSPNGGNTQCVQYFSPGHLQDNKISEYKKRMKMLAITYLTFSPDGNELLVNLGGEQVYIYDINNRRPTAYNFSLPEAKQVSSSEETGNGFLKRSHLTESVAQYKVNANTLYENGDYCGAIELYNTAISKSPHAAVLYSNRAAAFLKRQWSGDVYDALRDCQESLRLDPQQYKAYYRMCQCLVTLKRLDEAKEVFSNFVNLFPDVSRGASFETLEKNIFEASDKKELSSGDMSEVERYYREISSDYKHRFCGHCNTTTDIKEANYFGSDGSYICAGSDDGSFFIWDKKTSNILRVIKGDDCIVNCLQPHPDVCFLATSGVDDVIRLWSPLAEEVVDERIVRDTHAAAAANQKRMNQDPLETMLLSMGYRLSHRRSSNSDTNTEGSDSREDMQCRPF